MTVPGQVAGTLGSAAAARPSLAPGDLGPCPRGHTPRLPFHQQPRPRFGRVMNGSVAAVLIGVCVAAALAA